MCIYNYNKRYYQRVPGLREGYENTIFNSSSLNNNYVLYYLIWLYDDTASGRPLFFFPVVSMPHIMKNCTFFSFLLF